MAHTPSTHRTALLACAGVAALTVLAGAADPTQIVLQNGRAIPLASLTREGDKFVVQTATQHYPVGQSIPFPSADHVYGEKPAAVNRAVALLLRDNAKEAQRLLEPVVAEHRISAQIPGNFWMEPARALLVAYALTGDAAKCTELGKEISDATPAQGIDPFVTLGKALQMPATIKLEEREAALRDLTTDNLPADVCAYASYFRGNLFRQGKKAPEALEAYLSVPCLFPSGGLVLNSAAEIQAADLLIALKRQEEATALLKSVVRNAHGTILIEEANKRLESLK